ncbi:hypothetical protein BABINDRAFT_160633 [Babjeviella inositovora NRRL Y-12698]|uniref:Vacuolar ATPase assembly integral membrane protein VMA21 n=1 Tax=Babjeviella inositovora NRRL Y-12698 TaxID=984486 RepID=A0A1E3QUB0_9ASCO|nr:uncharacterized protein BABINDRAFT_160633 [Babjeviella inositovora NRRL Y-12698]ODQ81259.1 hypothetical protein BABINDRAFT_160633 [Babjeviella inositovora NRRL Y-12698]
MIIFPLVTFFSVLWITGGNAIVSGGLAALMANVVLIGYVVVAFMENTEAEALEKKNE